MDPLRDEKAFVREEPSSPHEHQLDTQSRDVQPSAVEANTTAHSGAPRALPNNFPVTPSPPYRRYDKASATSHTSPDPHPLRIDVGREISGSSGTSNMSERIPQSPSEKVVPRFDPNLPGLGYTVDGPSPLVGPIPSNSYVPSTSTAERTLHFGGDHSSLGYAVNTVYDPTLVRQVYQEYTPEPRTGLADEPFDPYFLQPGQSFHGPSPSLSSMGSHDHRHDPHPDVAGSLYHASSRSDGGYVEGTQPGTHPIDIQFNVRMAVPDTRDPGYVLSKERMASLSEVDNANFSWFHMKVCLIAGVGFFTDAYDIFSINLAASMLQFVYPEALTPTLSGAIKAAAPVGTLIGQLVFGYLADHIGRKRMYGVELIIIIIGTFGQTLTSNADVGTINIFAALFVWRLIMGLGIGGDYPLSAVIASEFASKHIRGRMLTAVFANQGWGQFAASIVGAIIILAFKNSFSDLSVLSSDPTLRRDIDQAWRILIGLGCIPAAIALWFRLTIPETPRYTMDIERNVRQATEDIDTFLNTGGYKFDPDSIVVRVIAPRASFSDFQDYFSIWKNLKILVGCAYSWFAIDVVFYGLGLNTSTFFGAIGFSPTPTSNSSAGVVFRDFENLCSANMLLSAVGLVPGYWATFLLIDFEYERNGRKYQLGRKGIQLIGFGVLTVLFLAMGASFSHLIPKWSEAKSVDSLFSITAGARIFLFLFILQSFFQNFGPNTTTFIIPGETFPTRYRSTCHGLCAASGKIGAIISQFAFQHSPPNHILLAYLAFTITGFLATLLVEETNQESLEDLSNEEQHNFILGPVQAPSGTFTALQHVLPTMNTQAGMIP